MSRFALVLVALATFGAPADAADFGPGFKTRSLPVDGGTVSVTVGGSGPAVVLMHGYAETAQMWKPLATALAPRFTVIAVDLPGIGDSSIPTGEVDMKSAAQRIHAAIRALGIQKARVVGHDIGLMVAYAYAALYPQEVEKLAVMDAFLPGIAGWEAVFNSPNLWHFRFHGRAPAALVKGRERVYFDYYWNEFAANAKRSLSDANRRTYAQAYARPGRMAAGWAYFASFPKTATDFAELGKTKLTMPVLSIGGDKSLGEVLAAQMKLVAPDVTVVIVKDAGHWILEEQPADTIAALTAFLDK
jgi:pimeloyl-ACP methyl ester carboxylesterase